MNYLSLTLWKGFWAFLVTVEILVQMLTEENREDTAAIGDCVQKLDFKTLLRRWRFFGLIFVFDSRTRVLDNPV